MIQEIELKGEKRLALLFDDGVTREQIELYRCGLLDLSSYAAFMAGENQNIEPALYGICHAIKVARMMEQKKVLSLQQATFV